MKTGSTRALIITFVTFAVLFLSLLGTSIGANPSPNENPDIVPVVRPPGEMPVRDPKWGNKDTFDLVLKKFELSSNNITVNDTLTGTFEAEVITNKNTSNLSNTAKITVNVLNYSDVTDFNQSGIYEINPITFSEAGTYYVVLELENRQDLKESSKHNNKLVQSVVVNEYSDVDESEPDNEGDENVDNSTGDSEAGQITGFDIFDIIQSAKPISRSLIYLNGMLIQSVDAEGNLFYHQDSHSNIILVSDDNQNLVQENLYEPFGKKIQFISHIFNNIGYSGKEADNNKFVYFGARYYDSEIARFNSLDRVTDYYESGYNYVKNNPLVIEDPDGKKPRRRNIVSESIPKVKTDPIYFNDMLYPKDQSKNPRGALTLRSVSVLDLIIKQVQLVDDVRKAHEITKLNDNFIWNQFWVKYIPRVNSANLRDPNTRGWTNEFTGVYYPDKYKPTFRYDVSLMDVEYAMTQINSEVEVREFLTLVGFDIYMGRIYFREFGKDPISENLLIEYQQMRKRVRDFKIPNMIQKDTLKDNLLVFSEAKRDDLSIRNDNRR